MGRTKGFEVYEGMPDHPAVTTAAFAEENGRTTLTVLVEHASHEARDFHVESGMEGSLQEALDKLEQLAVSLR